MARDQRLVELENKLEDLKRQYDMYLTGARRTEPLALRTETEREILLLTRFPSSSTMFKFQVKTLAMRFRSFETQMRNLMELRQQRAVNSEKVQVAAPLSDIVVDEMAIDNPAIIAAKVKTLLAQVGSKTTLPPGMTVEALSAMMVNKARGLVGKNNVKAIKYSLVAGDQGAKVKGEVISVQEPAVN